MKTITHVLRASGEKKTVNIDPDLVDTVRQTVFTDRLVGRTVTGSLVTMADGTLYWCLDDAAHMRRHLEIIEPQPEGSPTPPDLLDLARHQAPGKKAISLG